MLRMNVLAICPIPTDGTAWWRVVSPLSNLREASGGHFEFTVQSTADHVQISKCDLLILQRPCRAEDVAYMTIAQGLGIPVVVDYDDDYTNVPANNPRSAAYMAPEVQKNVRECLSGANLVCVSTLELKQRFRAFNQRIAVVPNAWDDRVQLERGAPRLPTKNIAWRGGDSHNEDLAVFSESIVRAAWEGGETLWHFVGASLHFLHSRMPPASVNEYQFRDVLSYFSLLGQIRPSILIVPLADTPFNRCKSNISILEGAFAGAAVLAPDWDGWRAPGVTNYTSPADFAHKLIELSRMPQAELSALSQQTWDTVRGRMLVSRANKLRALMFGKLCDEAQATKRVVPLETEPGKGDKLDEIVQQQTEEKAS
jgi:O-antigen biosynthesis protein